MQEFALLSSEASFRCQVEGAGSRRCFGGRFMAVFASIAACTFVASKIETRLLARYAWLVKLCSSGDLTKGLCSEGANNTWGKE